MVSSEQRRRQLAREKYERQMQRRAEAEAKRKKRNTVVGASVAAVLVLGFAGAYAGGVFKADDKKSSADVAVPTAVPTPTQGKQYPAEPAMTVDTKAAYTAVLETNSGKITVSLDAAKAPHTVNSFAFLAGEKYFDGTKCHRLTTQGIYVLQCGDPTGTGRGGPGYKFADENLEGATYPAGTLAMANSGPNTNGSQFFVVYKDTQLPPSYTPFGKITGGLDVVQKIAEAGVKGGGGDGAPAKDVQLTSVTAAKG
ncbi:peptidylprolyl isomerase [Kitasatospora camelliae]|uniref:Peptidyl-prolyl cis-trans isomerase n=1 Tax=Kitasatospora camelliae TaxID=3156397 RepID=A0AAU8K5G3_9ACTN